jgi:hypothetical protein
MASNKYYGYYLRGKQIALIEEDLDDNNRWKSPVDAITDGIEVEYAYSPRYRINNTATAVACDRYTNSNGLLKIVDAADGLPTSGVTYIVISGSEKWNGLHKVNTLAAGHTILETKYNGGSVTEAFTTYTDIDALTDESDEIDLPEYLAKALVYYVKAKVAEDRMDIEAKEYFMAEFRKMVEKQESSKVWGLRKMSSAPSAIK